MHDVNKSDQNKNNGLSECKIDFDCQLSYPVGTRTASTIIWTKAYFMGDKKESCETSARSGFFSSENSRKPFIHESESNFIQHGNTGLNCVIIEKSNGKESYEKKVHSAAIVQTSGPDFIRKLEGSAIEAEIKLTSLYNNEEYKYFTVTQTSKFSDSSGNFFEIQTKSNIENEYFQLHSVQNPFPTPAHEAVSLLHYDKLKKLLKENPDYLNIKDSYGYTPLCLAIENLCLTLKKDVNHIGYLIIDYLIDEKGASSFYTLLFGNCYVDHNDSESLEKLSKDSRKYFMGCVSPILSAIKKMDVDLIKKLVDAGAPLEYKFMSKNIIFRSLCNAVACVAQLPEYSSIGKWKTFENNVKMILGFILEKDRELIFSISGGLGKRCTFNKGLSTLHEATRWGRSIQFIAEYIIQHAQESEINWHHKDADGMNVLLSTISYVIVLPKEDELIGFSLETCKLMESLLPSYELMKLLLDSGADIILEGVCHVTEPFCDTVIGDFTALQFCQKKREEFKVDWDDLSDVNDQKLILGVKISELDKVIDLFSNYSKLKDMPKEKPSTHIDSKSSSCVSVSSHIHPSLAPL